MAVIRHHVGKRLSEIAVHNGTVYLAGQIAEDADQDITGQTREVLGHIDRLLAEVDSDKSLLLSVQIYIADMVHFAGMNAVWDEWVAQGDTPPAPPSKRSLRTRSASLKWSLLPHSAAKSASEFCC